MNKCEDCVSRYICFLSSQNEPCLGYNDKEMFWKCMSVHFPLKNIKTMRKGIEGFQERNAERKEE